MRMLLRHFTSKECGGQWSSRNDRCNGKGGENEASSHFERLNRSVIQISWVSECVDNEANETSSGVFVQRLMDEYVQEASDSEMVNEILFEYFMRYIHRSSASITTVGLTLREIGEQGSQASPV